MPPTTISTSLELLRRAVPAFACFAWVCFATASASAQARPAAVQGRAELLRPHGVIEVQRAGAGPWMAVATNTVLQPGDIVRTGKGSRALVHLAGGSVIRLDEHSLLQIQPKEAGFFLKMLRGAGYFFHRERPVRTDFETPLVSGAIRGTEFHLAVEENGRTVLTLLDGSVELTNASGQLALGTGGQAVVEPNQPPRQSAVLDATNIIQWCLYYPGIIHLAELSLGPAEQQALAESLAAYRAGDLVAAFAKYPEGRQPGSNEERIYLAQLLLAMGQVAEAETLLNGIAANDGSRIHAEALRTLIAAVKFQPRPAAPEPRFVAVLLAESYYYQSQADLPQALASARSAVAPGLPQSGFAWARVAELEFSFGRIGAARRAIDKALQLTPRNAQAHALKGFLLAADGHISSARDAFDDALAIDSALANVWLGRGLCRIRQGDVVGGRDDLLIAAAVEPNRALLRSYLGKAWSASGDSVHASRELDLAKRIDPKDPTAWLYSALLNQQGNRINTAVRELEHSQTLNENRRLYRSRLLIEQDRAVRGVNLARVYEEAGMSDLGAREAGRAVTADYANPSAHLFLANSYAALSDPNTANLRYETATLSELLVSQLLSPVGVGSLSRYVSQQEYSRLLERDGFGLTSYTEYLSRGDWVQAGSQYGRFGGFGYSVDAGYRSFNGQRPNNDLTDLSLYGTVKQEITPQDSVYFQAGYYDLEGGDLRQYYDPASASHNLRIEETQEPNLLAGYHHEWAPGSHTLLLGARLHDDFQLTDAAAGLLIALRNNGTFLNLASPQDSGFSLRTRTEFVLNSAELQHIEQLGRHTLVLGARAQAGDTETRVRMTNLTEFVGKTFPSRQSEDANLSRYTAYAYETWQPWDPLWLVGGVSYDWLEYPENLDVPPIGGGHARKDQLSPKAGLVWMPTARTALRGAYTRSLGGLYFDNSVRLEPTQVGGFNQAYRSLVPESVGGLAAGTRFETWSAEAEHRFPTRTYLGVRGELLRSEVTRKLGAFDLELLGSSAAPADFDQNQEFRERALTVTLNQLFGEEWALGARYRLSDAELCERLAGIAPNGDPRRSRDLDGVLHQFDLYAAFNHSSGFYAQFHALWNAQSSSGYRAGTPMNGVYEKLELADESFWQLNVLAGWRFARRRADVALGVLNITDEDYRLNPLNYHLDLPRGRTLLARVRLNF